MAEICEIVSQMKDNRSPGENQIRVGIVKNRGQKLLEEIMKIKRQCWRQKKIPKSGKDQYCACTKQLQTNCLIRCKLQPFRIDYTNTPKVCWANTNANEKY